MINYFFYNQNNSGILVIAIEDCFLIAWQKYTTAMVTTEMGQDVSLEAENRTKHQIREKSPNYSQVILFARSV